MKKLSMFVSALVAACLATPTYAATVTWDPEGGTLLSNLIQSVWTQAGNHTVVIPSGNYIGVSYSDWGAQLLFEPGAPGVTGSRAATSLTIQGAGKTSSYLGFATAGNNSGFIRATNVDFSGVTFKDISIATGGTQLITNGPSSLGLTFNNADVFLGVSSRTNNVTNLIGKMNNGSSGPGDVGKILFTNGSFIRSAGTAPVLFRADSDFTNNVAGGGFAQFDVGTGISAYNATSGGAYSFNTAAMLNTSNYQTSTVDIANLFNVYNDGSVSASYQNGQNWQQGNAQTLAVDGEYFTDSLGGVGAAGWSGGLAVAPVPEPSSIALLGMAGSIGVVSALRRRRK